MDWSKCHAEDGCAEIPLVSRYDYCDGQPVCTIHSALDCKLRPKVRDGINDFTGSETEVGAWPSKRSPGPRSGRHGKA